VGIHAAERLDLRALGVVGHLLRFSSNAREAYDRCVPLLKILVDPIRFELIADEKSARLLYHDVPNPQTFHPQSREFALALVVLLFRRLVPEVEIASAHFLHPGVDDRAEHRRVFGCSVSFNCGHTELRFPARFLAAPFQRADPEVMIILKQYAQILLERLPPLDDESLPAMYIDALLRGKTTIHMMARTLGIGYRTLQRRLQQSGTSHREMADAARRQLAQRYLAATDWTVHEIAKRLGFSNSNAFYRAFRRWTGKAPSTYRAQTYQR
jgi:AraC-like DNA-binding protein